MHDFEIRWKAERVWRRGQFDPLDLVPLDVYVWQFVTDKYFVGLPTNIDDLRTWIAGAVGEVTPDLLRRTWEERYYRWDICGAASRSHSIQYFWHHTKFDVLYARCFYLPLLVNAYTLSKL